MGWIETNWQGVLALAAIVGVVGLAIQLLMSRAGRGGAAGTVAQDTRGVNVQVGGSHPEARCPAPIEGALVQLTVIQGQQTKLMEQIREDQRVAAEFARSDSAARQRHETRALEILAAVHESLGIRQRAVRGWLDEQTAADESRPFPRSRPIRQALGLAEGEDLSTDERGNR